MISIVGILISLGVSALVAYFISKHFSEKAEKLEIDLTGFTIKEITGRDINPILKNGKLTGKNFKTTVKISGSGNIIVKGIKKE